MERPGSRLRGRFPINQALSIRLQGKSWTSPKAADTDDWALLLRAE
jgi:hypothetical protein